jgi:hypothetical protein
MTPSPAARLASAAAAALALLLAAAPHPALGEGASQTAPSKAAPAKAAPAKAPPAKAKAPAADPNVAEKEFTVTLMTGAKMKCTVYPNPDWVGKIVRFEPAMEPKENNVFSAALNSMWEIYGRQQGAFTIQDGSLSSREGLAGQVIVYKLRTGRKFLVYPIRDDKTKTLTGMRVWME